MSTNDPMLPAHERIGTATQPAAPAPTPHKPVNKLLVALIAVSVLAVILAITTILQRDQAVDARASLAEIRSELQDAEAELSDAEAELSDAEAELSDAEATVEKQEDQLAACADVVDVSDHQYEQLQLLADAVSQSLDMNFTTVAAKLKVAKPHADKVNEIIQISGFSDWGSFFAACSPEHKLL